MIKQTPAFVRMIYLQHIHDLFAIHKYINKDQKQSYLHGVLRTVQTKRVCVRVTDEVKIVVIKSLHR